MPERVLALPAPARPRHRRHPVRTGVLNVTAKVGSAVTLVTRSVVLAATTAGMSAGPAAEQPTKVVTFEIAGR